MREEIQTLVGVLVKTERWTVRPDFGIKKTDFSKNCPKCIHSSFKIAQKVAEHLNYFCKKSFKNSPIWPHCQCRNLQIRNCGHQPDENAVSWQRRAWNLGEDDGDEGVGDVVVDHRQPLARNPFVALNHGRLSNQSFFKKCAIRGLFLFIFVSSNQQ